MSTYNGDAYHHYTTTCLGNTVDPDGLCSSCHKVSITARVSTTTATNEVCGPNSNVIQVTVTRTAEEVIEDLGFDEDLKPEPKRKKETYRPVVRPINEGWKAKWRLTQQRPRDGLR